MKKNIYSKGLLLAVILLYFTSCNNLEEIGLELQGDNLIVSTHFTDTITVKTSVTLVDSLITNNKILIGNLNDDKFGKTSTSSYLHLRLDTLDFLESADAIFDSAKVFFAYTLVSGEENNSQTFDLYELTQGFDDSIYYQTSNLEFDPNLLGSTEVNPSTDTVDIFTIRADGYGQKIFEYIKNFDDLNNPDKVDETFKGIKVAPAPEDDGFALKISLPTSQSPSIPTYVRIYYRTTDSETVKTKTLYFNRSFYNATLDLSSNPALAGLQFGESIPTSQLQNEGYFIGGTGLTLKIEFPYLDQFKGNNVEFFGVNRAQLSFDPVEGSISNYGTPSGNLSFIVLSEDGELNFSRRLLDEASLPLGQDGRRITVSEVFGSTTPIKNMVYNSSAGTYPMAEMTSYMQEIIEGTRKNTGFYLDLNPLRNENINRLLISDPDHPGESKLRLRIFYSIL
ncbi:DUF4270 family protein [Flexithrix dorotheae]|uniref:DUF4270 family protein n=1 Tax=Flexithrix dorotheae TaxID=70993 RepID=UPI000367254B|nr:DUF4270 family protein [Flexithrix dorotheae]